MSKSGCGTVFRVVGVLTGVCLVVTACSGGGTVVSADLADGAAEVEVGSTVDVPAGPEIDVVLPEVGPLEVLPEVNPMCTPGDGCFGEPCQAGSDCLSGFCVDHMGSGVCTTDCIEECPAGFSCQLVSGLGPDMVNVCVSTFRVLCRPCATAADCVSATGQQDVCVDYGPGGRFCGGACDGDTACPEGYDCNEVPDEKGSLSWQCVPADGVCTCSEKSVLLGLSTPCEISNDAGACAGIRVCTKLGLSACDAATPAVESCNGLNDDCDGELDEDTCDDGNACTKDSCGGEGGCGHQPLSGTNCDDGDTCTVTDHCEAGMCTGTLVACDDGNACTDDSCDGASGCKFSFNTVPCDDGNPCTLGDACNKGLCGGVEVPCDCTDDSDCKKLEDGNACNGKLFCDQSGVQYQCKVAPDTIVVCPEPSGVDAPCLDATCDPATGKCSVVAANEGQECDDDSLCTVGDACAAGKCVSGIEASCEDYNPCTQDSCKPQTGCLHAPASGDCSDGNACTAPDKCGDGACIPGLPVDCDDSNPCTQDSCKPATGCSHTPVEKPCDDGNACSSNDQCKGGICTGTSWIDCNDGNPCTDDSCQPGAGCVHQLNNAPCTDGNQCTQNDSCQGGKCAAGAPMSCDDGNTCTEDACNPLVGCTHTLISKPCDDLDPCTTNDSCYGGVCVGILPLDCDDANPCTNDVCVPMAGCSHANNELACTDGNPCTVGDKCLLGKCMPGTALKCDDSNPCTDDSCDKTAGCVFKANSGGCDDTNPCTTGDHCEAGVCKATGSLDCDDGDVCTTDSCAPGGGCTHAFNKAPCDDDDACTLKDACLGGVCKGTVPVVCNDLNPCSDDSCDPAAGCKFIPNQVPCDDGNACTQNDKCGAGVCKAGTAFACEDANPCTSDSCDPAAGCVYSVNKNPCDDGDVCTVSDVCDKGSCVPGAPLKCDDANLCTDDSCAKDSGCVHAANSAACTDNSLCTDGDKCVAGACVPGKTVSCDDSNPCTTDTCDPAAGCVNTKAPDNTPCTDDGSACTLDVCKAGVCTHEGAGWTSYGGHCYRYFPETKTWSDARAACQALSADLVSISDGAENDFVATLAAETFYTGYNDQASEGAWGWIDGTPNTYTHWAPSEPNNSGNEDCMHYYIGGTYPKYWNDIQCGATQPYMCEKK